MRKIKWLRLFFFAPLLFLFIFTNIYQDPANIYHDESKEMAKAILNGNAVYSGSGNVDEREVKRNLIKDLPDDICCIAVGPSLIMTVNRDIVGTDRFLNLGVSGADIYDILAQFGLMELYGKKPERVILCLDSYSFDEHFYAAEGARNLPLRKYADHMLDIINGRKTENINTDDVPDIRTMAEQAFSVTYFQAAADQIVRNNKYVMTENRWGIVKEGFDGSKAYYNTDGSWTYAASFQANDRNDVLKYCAEYDIANQFASGRHISEFSKDTFEKLITYLADNGVETELFLCPLAPSLWDRIEAEKDRYHVFEELSEFASEIAEKYDLKITGAYDPYKLGMTDADFYDSRHVRRELMGKYFDFQRQ